MFQFTRPRGARPEIIISRTRVLDVSIHTPAWGATSTATWGLTTWEFQFTRPRGARPRDPWYLMMSRMFQFTRPRGARPGKHQADDQTGNVSIHTPAWGATASSSGFCHNRMFQFTRPRGARHVQRHKYRRRLRFQFTRPRGARHTGTYVYDVKSRFNSHARVGRDII